MSEKVALTEKEILHSLVESLDLKTLRVIKLLFAIRTLSNGTDDEIHHLAEKAINELARPDQDPTDT